MPAVPGPFSSSLSLAHVSYVVDPAKMEALKGTDWGFVMSPMSDPLYLGLTIATVVITAAAFFLCQRIGPVRGYLHRYHDRCLSYHRYIPLILRIALGMVLIVSGSTHSIYLPNVRGAHLTNVQVVLGFCLLTGFMVRLSGVMALGIFVYGLTQSHYLMGTLESAAAAILIVIYGPDTPSADHLFEVDHFGDRFEPMFHKLRDATGPLIRVAMGTTLMWLAITEKALNPRVTEAVIIDFELPSVIPVSTAMWVFSVGMIEFAVGLVLVLGFFTRSFAAIGFVVLSLSFLFFREEVAGHLTFFASLLVLMITGAGRISIDSVISNITQGFKGTDTLYYPELAPEFSQG
jgi:uncharacterized membrane protein YphA (DoxX/SURF4 family)